VNKIFGVSDGTSVDTSPHLTLMWNCYIKNCGFHCNSKGTKDRNVIIGQKCKLVLT